MNTFSNIIGAAVLISVLLPWFLIAVTVVSVLYAMTAAFYRASAREMKVRFPQRGAEFFLRVPAATGRDFTIVIIFPFL